MSSYKVQSPAFISLLHAFLIAITFTNLSIDVEMTIEPPSSVGMEEIKGTPSPKKRIRAVLSVEGYILPDPEVPNRLTGKPPCCSQYFPNGNLDLTKPNVMILPSLVHRCTNRENEHGLILITASLTFSFRWKARAI